MFSFGMGKRQPDRDYLIDVPASLRPTLTFAIKELSTGANGQKEDAASFFVRAALIERSSVSVLAFFKVPG